MICFLFLYKIYLGILFSLFYIVIAIINYRSIKLLNEKRQQHIQEISIQIDKANKKAYLDMPIGMIIYNENYVIEWVNPYFSNIYPSSLTEETLQNVFSTNFVQAIRQGEEETWLDVGDLHFKVIIDASNQTLYFFNRSEVYKLKKAYENERVVLANIYLDNYDEISRSMEDNLKSKINSEVTATLNHWAEAHQFYIKRISQDRFLAVLTEEVLQKLEESRFQILDEIRKIQLDKMQRNPITLSIGIGSGNVTILELSKLAQSSLDLVLGRGGDQVAIRDESGKVRFYGGKTNPMEKRTRVRARVISHALTELVKESENVIIMGHKSPDMDSLGSTIGVLNIARSNHIEGYIIFDEKDVTTGVSRVIEKIKQDEELWNYFISPEEAEEIFTNRSLVVVVDTHRPSMVTHKDILLNAQQKVIIDHHRRGEDFVEDPTLVYMEPYASSTAELVTELIEYQPRKKPLTVLEATALLAGITVDTKSFSFRTGSRTFDAASYLRIKGADPVLVQHFLKENLQTYIKRNKLIENVYLYKDTIAIVKAPPDEIYNHILIAQTADTLLTINNVSASFVIAYSEKDMISISARSLGDMNVQIIMENLDGGGHLTNAATQLKGVSIDEAEQKVIKEIDAYFSN